jgi:hypothetical protein
MILVIWPFLDTRVIFSGGMSRLDIFFLIDLKLPLKPLTSSWGWERRKVLLSDSESPSIAKVTFFLGMDGEPSEVDAAISMVGVLFNAAAALSAATLFLLVASCSLNNTACGDDWKFACIRLSSSSAFLINSLLFLSKSKE